MKSIYGEELFDRQTELKTHCGEWYGASAKQPEGE